MRIAVLVYGRLNKCVEHYDNIMEHIGNHHTIDMFMSSDNSSEPLLEGFLELYKPIAYTNDPITYDYDLGAYPGKRHETNIHNMTCHYINKNRVFALLEEYVKKANVHYEVVLSLRLDCVFQNRFDFHGIAENTIYIPSGNDFWGINDQLAYGSLDTMKQYNSIDAKMLLDRKLSIPHPECLCLANIQFHKLRIQRVHLQYHRDV
jgi:hypothetical protein